MKTAPQDLVSIPLIKTLLVQIESAQHYQFDLGDDIMACSPDQASSRPPSEADDLFLIVSGTVRLLTHNEGLQKTVSVACLGPGEAFGCDRTFCGHPLPYWAKAAASCQLVRLPNRAVERALSQWPLVLSHLQRQTQRRSQLAFFKQYTPLGALPSKVLSGRLLPQLVEQPLQAGSTLGQYPLIADEYLWLRHGCLLNPAAPNASSQVGDGWLYAPRQGNWTCQTSGLLYRLALHTPELNAIKQLL
ncbi:cyclic nucleotide-binding domain-containing protein [Nodosilinea sp. LEGE 07298]|uniref:cyclic nucleotide-binding domain-containing protein n=1 Tax=Nodosilinea sp. LEGE 07298 TaxID=2777970 RepID=UPI001881BD41|nr:cyclic nucleotide-binding domain-containing protein [Nodosilinea sp. LEGE 07298]MBE9111674.1 cyclic nucleotide-binding domain-containing protein [Nodosilinea sp. LEGE 07298]